MSTQSDYEKNRAAALAAKKKVNNQRDKDNIKKNAAKAIKMYGDKIHQIETVNIKPAKQEIAILETTIAIRKRQWNDEYRLRQPLTQQTYQF
jgi:ribosome-binding protein aMBF1 (putative translation factor)